MQTSSKGFSLPLLIAIIATFGVVGFITWRIFASQQPNQTGTASQNQQQAANPNEGYVVIEEWGVRFKPVEGVGTVIHKAWPTQAMPGVGGAKLPDGSVRIVVSTQELADLSEDCNVNENSTAVWELYRTPKSLDLPQAVIIGKIGDSYYYYFGAQAACVTNRTDLDLNSTTSGKLRESLKTLEAAM